MGRRKGYNKDKRDGGRFIQLPVCVLDSPAYLTASPNARMLLLELAVQYQGNNNGDLACPWRAMAQRGFRSPATLHNAKLELLAHGLICETRKGGYPNKASLYALTWLALDECGGKLDWGAVAYTKLRGAYRKYQPPGKPPVHFNKRRRKVSDTAAVSRAPASRTYGTSVHPERPPPAVSIGPENAPRGPRQPYYSIDIPGGIPLSGVNLLCPERVRLGQSDSPAAHRAAECWGLIETSPGLYEHPLGDKPVTSPGTSFELAYGPVYEPTPPTDYENPAAMAKRKQAARALIQNAARRLP